MEAACVIVGGGISGLAAAHELHKRRIPFLLVEKAPRYGGVIRTEHVDGFVVDAGADALLTQKPAGVGLCAELGVAVSPAKSTRAFVARHGRLRPLPDAGVLGIPTNWRSFAVSRAFSPAGKLRMAAEYFLPPSPARPGADESIASFIARRFGREALERLGEPLLAGIHGGDADRLSMRALFPRFIDLEQSDGSVIRGLRRLRPKSAGVPPAPFVSIRGGTNTLVNALVGSLPPASLMADVSVTALEWRGGWRVHLTTGRHLDVPAVLLATPPRAIANLVEHVDAELSGLFAYLKDVSLITVALGYRCSDSNLPLAGSGFVVPKSEHATVNAVTWVSSKWTERAPEDHILLRAAVGGARNPNASLWSNTDILTRVREDVRRYLGVSCAPVFSRVYRMPHAGVLMEVGHLDLVERIQARLDASPGLFVSAAGVRGVGIADCVGDARSQAAAVAEYVRCSERHSCPVQLVRPPVAAADRSALQSRHAAHR